MRPFALILSAIAAVAITGIAAAFILAGGARVTVISISNVSSEALSTVKDIFPVEEGVYCAFEGCCKGEGGVKSLDLDTGAVICASGAVSHCRCETHDLLIRRGQAADEAGEQAGTRGTAP